MNNNILHIAQQTIPRPKGLRTTLHENGDTDDIITSVLSIHRNSVGELDRFAAALRQTNLSDYFLVQSIFELVESFNYKIDPAGYQLPKHPTALFADRDSDQYQDCKSFSIFTNVLLQSLSIPCLYRFVSFERASDTVTHVYPVAIVGGREIILDAVYAKESAHGGYNKEKKYTYKKDYPMTKIIEISGTGNTPQSTGMNLDPRFINNEGYLDISIAEENAKIDRDNASRVLGIGHVHTQKLEDAVMALSEAKRAIVSGDTADYDGLTEQVHNNEHHFHKAVASIGDVGRLTQKRASMLQKMRQDRYDCKNNTGSFADSMSNTGELIESIGGRRKANRKAKRAAKKAKRGGKTRFGSFIKKAGDKAKKGLKTLTKVVTAPFRLAAKAVLEVALPKASMFFLYLFVKDPALVNKLPANAQSKRRKAEKVSKVIIKGIGMKENHFMGIVRNGIKKKNGGKEPEAILSAMMGGVKIASIGDIGLIDDVITVVISLIKKLTKKGEKEEDVTADDMPSEEDFADMTPSEKEEVMSKVKNQKANEQGDDEDGDSDGATDKKGRTRPSESDGGQPKKGMC